MSISCSPRRRSIALVVGLAIAICGTLLTAAESGATARGTGTHKPKPTIVLVHGAFADSSSWNGEVARLLHDGYPVIAAADPLRGEASDAAYVRAILNTVTGPVVLVGHSYGGSVITAAALDDANVKALVYVAGFAPDTGESALELTNKFPGSTLAATLEQIPLADGTIDLRVRQDLFPNQFAADVPLFEARLMAVDQRPIAAAALNEAFSGEPAWRTSPSYFLIPTGDKNIPPAAQQFMAERAHGTIVTVRNASHAVLVSQPGITTALIERAANETS